MAVTNAAMIAANAERWARARPTPTRTEPAGRLGRTDRSAARAWSSCGSS